MAYFINLLTFSRIFLGVIIFALLTRPEGYFPALILFFIAGASDYFDGYLARKYNLESTLGAVIDPIADKILITFTVIALSVDLGSSYVAFLGSIMLAREYWVSALRDFNAREGNINATQVTLLAKIKTAVQLGTFCLYLLGLYLNNALIVFVANFFLFTALIITLQTGLSYTISTFKK